jgi:hypothetical protein
MKSPIAYLKFFGARFVIIGSNFQKVAVVQKQKSIRFVRMICSMFMGYLVQTG